MQTWKVGLYHASIHCEVYDVVESARPVAHEAATTTLDVQSVQLGTPKVWSAVLPVPGLLLGQ